MRRRTLLLGAATLVAGCSSATPAVRSTADPKALLVAARANLNATEGVHIDMVGADIPKGISAVLAARGDGAPTPAWQGRIKLQTRGSSSSSRSSRSRTTCGPRCRGTTT
ncbi:hypothetical protein [Branchiibius cervicis]|uniref:Uncharacterized protein n=1 Tax=Branchiibius cervicis TaxID=908252 RepID=A0ABW2AYB5_9MICO